MDWLGTFFDTFTGGLPSAARTLCPDHLKRKWLERLADHNPFRTISANKDLVRATRLAWIEAAQDVLKEGKARASDHEWRELAPDIHAFDHAITDILLHARDHALDRRKDTGASPVDVHVQAVIEGVPQLIAPGDHTGVGSDVTAGFVATLADLSGWKARDIPAIYQRIAVDGLPIHGGGSNRTFGELVFAAFAELIKDPKKYPHARAAFYIAMNKLGRDIGRATLGAVSGLDDKLDGLIKRVDALKAFRKGVKQYLALLPGIAADVAAANRKLDKVVQRLDAPINQILRRMFRVRDGVAREDAVISAFHYTLKLDPFVGRANVIRTIETDFLDDGLTGPNPPRFRWMALCGEGGTGKSRLAQQIVDQNKAVWVHSGFIESEFLKLAGQVYEIGANLTGPVFMVVDYAVAERTKADLPSFMMAWAEYSHSQNSHPVRIMVITRRDKELLLEELRGKGLSPNRDLSRVEEIRSSPVVLKHLERSEAVELMRTRIRLTADLTGSLPVEVGDDALITALDRFDDRRRPLFAAMVAAEIQRGTLPDHDTSQESNRLSLFGTYLERQENDHWLPYARDLREDDALRAVRRHANLVRLATCCGDVGVQLVSSQVAEEVRRGLGDFPELSVADRSGAIRAPLIGTMTGESPKDDSEAPCADFMPRPKIIPRLEPDLIGERFFLMTAQEVGDGENWARAEALAGLSWVCAPESAAAFLRMAAQDFPERMHEMRWLPPRPRDKHPSVLKARAKMLRNVCADIATRYGRTTISPKDLERLFDIVDQFDEDLVALAEVDAECREHYGQVLRQVANIGGRLANASLPFLDPISAVEDEERAPARRSDVARAFARGGASDGGVAGRLDSEDSVQPLPPALAIIVVKRLPPLLDRAGRLLLRPGPYLERQPLESAVGDVLAAVHFRHRHDPNLGGRWPTPRDSASDAVLRDWRVHADNLNRGDIDDITVLAGLVSIFAYADYESSVEHCSSIYPAIGRALGLVDRIHPASAGRICSMLGNALVLHKTADELTTRERTHIADSIGIYLRLAVLVDFAEDVSPQQVRRVLGNFITTAFGVLLQGQKIADVRRGEAATALVRLLAMTPTDTPLAADFLSVLANLPEDLPSGIEQALREAFETRILSGAIDIEDFLSPNKSNLFYSLGQLVFGVPQPRLRLSDDIARALLQMLAAKVGVKAIRAVLKAVPWTLEHPAEVRAKVPLDLMRNYVDGLRRDQGFDGRDYVSAAKLAIWGHDILNGCVERVQNEIAVLWDATDEPAASRGRGLAVWGVALVFDATRVPNDFTEDWSSWLKEAELLEADSERQRLLGIGFGARDAEEYIRDYNLALVDACMAGARLQILNGGDAADWTKEHLS